MRLTHKYKYKEDDKRFVFDMKDYRKACQKLGQLEDIEEELGIDLITLFKALQNGCYYKDKNGSIIYCNKPRLVPCITYELTKGHQNISGCELVVSKKSYKINANVYGKTWALTKEELL